MYNKTFRFMNSKVENGQHNRKDCLGSGDMQEYTKLKHIIRQYGMVDEVDYISSFGNTRCTDIQLYKINKNLSINSKYIIAIWPELEGENIILYRPDLMNIVNEINDRFISKSGIKGYDEKRNRVFGHYLRDGKLLIGNKLNEHFVIDFDILNTDQLVKKTDYNFLIATLINSDRHKTIQGLLIDLGRRLRLLVKVARDSMRESYNRINYRCYANLSIESLNPFDLEEKVFSIPDISETIKSIDRIDVIWYTQLNNIITDAFEIEFSEKYDAVFRRLNELDQIYMEQKRQVRLVIVGEATSKKLIIKKLKLLSYRRNFIRNNLYFLSIHDLADILNAKVETEEMERLYLSKLDNISYQNKYLT